MTFNEDGSRVRSGNGAENFSVLRRMALNLLKAEKTTKRSLAGKRKDAAWDDPCSIRCDCPGLGAPLGSQIDGLW